MVRNTMTLTQTGTADTTQAGESGTTRRLLYIHPDTMGFEADPSRNPLHFLSRYFEGDYLAVQGPPGQPHERGPHQHDAAQ